METATALRRWPWLKHPFPLLLYLEWVLLGIATLTALPTPFPGRRPRLRRTLEGGWGGEHLPLGVFLCIAALGILGLRLSSQRSQTQKILFTALGFGLSWLTILWGGQRGNSFPALLLVVVVRACLLFPWKGRLVTATLAFGSFVLRLLLGLRRFLDPDLARPERMPRNLSPEQVQGAVFNLTLNSALLFGLVLVFVLMMVSAILTERQSRDRLSLAHEKLRRYALLIENQATLQERNRIAREIHDSVGHSLTAQSIQLENVALWLSEDRQRAGEHLQKARRLGKEALQNVRQSVATLRQPPLQGQSFRDAIQKLMQEFERTTGIQTAIHLPATQQLPTEIAIALYRIVQEAMTNVAKHSQATEVSLTLTQSSTALELIMEDNGRGFDPTQNTTGFGLQSMRERAEALGGSFDLTSQPGRGCRLHLNIPQGGFR
ncbi:sensor histidine kinase [Altericista sp. CCNU0014]|uniref:sensor histidine kinase n=1 Tax=Altericista sp. CCNU0014 TaxID=3082949 RepID=UPI00384D17F3